MATEMVPFIRGYVYRFSEFKIDGDVIINDLPKSDNHPAVKEDAFLQTESKLSKDYKDHQEIVDQLNSMELTWSAKFHEHPQTQRS
jgi:hypothetical protein